MMSWWVEAAKGGDIDILVSLKVSVENDLVDIWIYSFNKWGVAQADKYIYNQALTLLLEIETGIE